MNVYPSTYNLLSKHCITTHCMFIRNSERFSQTFDITSRYLPLQHFIGGYNAVLPLFTSSFIDRSVAILTIYP